MHIRKITAQTKIRQRIFFIRIRHHWLQVLRLAVTVRIQTDFHLNFWRCAMLFQRWWQLHRSSKDGRKEEKHFLVYNLLSLGWFAHGPVEHCEDCEIHSWTTFQPKSYYRPKGPTCDGLLKVIVLHDRMVLHQKVTKSIRNQQQFHFAFVKTLWRCVFVPKGEVRYCFHKIGNGKSTDHSLPVIKWFVQKITYSQADLERFSTSRKNQCSGRGDKFKEILQVLL